MDPYENEMLKFVQMWKPYGGADDQVLPEFGMTVDVFYRRVLDILERPRMLALAYDERRDLRQFCQLKLRQCARSVLLSSVARPEGPRYIRHR
ncbi:hypothetical protein ABH922_005544 [Rhodococcus sp. 27YEA15]|uniref:DUF3263 domain-containing protein n=1 Tax=Rhodococcus sp. 27YEA15 TaxID=3156259 RepID=UPI003C7A7420